MRITVVFAALAALASCAEQDPDDRLPEAAHVEYIVPAILRPSCGTAACHSTATARNNYVLDTIEGACGAGFISPFVTGEQEPRMPLDSPLPQADIALIQAWEDAGFAGCFP